MYLKAASFGLRKDRLRQTEFSIYLFEELPLQFATIVKRCQTLQDLSNIVKGLSNNLSEPPLDQSA